MQNEVITILTT